MAAVSYVSAIQGTHVFYKGIKINEKDGRQQSRFLLYHQLSFEIPAPVLNTTVLAKEEDSESSVHVPTTTHESGKKYRWRR